RVGERIRQQLPRAELGDRPPECLDTARAPGDVRPASLVIRDRRRPETSRCERLGGQAQFGVRGPQIVVQPDIRLVEEQQSLRIDSTRTKNTRPEDGMQEEQRETSLRRHPGNAADRYVGSPRAVEKL